MKFWLYDILACPIDKYFPLTLYTFSYEINPEKIQHYIDIFKQRKLKIINEDDIIHIDKTNNTLLISDDIILEKNDINTYLELIVKSIGEFNHIHDKSLSIIINECLNLIKNEIKQKIQRFLENNNRSTIEEILPELYFLNKIKLNIEIETGLLFCKKCKRWFPITETIPQMLPDEFRNEEEDINFLKNIKNFMDDTFFEQDLKPFNLHF